MIMIYCKVPLLCMIFTARFSIGIDPRVPRSQVIVPAGGPTADFTYAASTVTIPAVDEPWPPYEHALTMRTEDIVAAMRRTMRKLPQLRYACGRMRQA
jgi:hypothetical protein